MATKRMTTEDLRGVNNVVLGSRVFANAVAVKNHHGRYNSARAAQEVIARNEQCISEEQKIQNVRIGGRKTVPSPKAEGRGGSRTVADESRIGSRLLKQKDS